MSNCVEAPMKIFNVYNLNLQDNEVHHNSFLEMCWLAN